MNSGYHRLQFYPKNLVENSVLNIVADSSAQGADQRLTRWDFQNGEFSRASVRSWLASPEMGAAHNIYKLDQMDCIKYIK